MKLLSIWPAGPQVLFCKKPITKLSDVKGLKVRVYDQNLAKFRRCLDFAATPLPANASARLIETVDRLEALEDVRLLAALAANLDRDLTEPCQ